MTGAPRHGHPAALAMQLGSSPHETAPEGLPQRVPELIDACNRHVVDEVTVRRHGDEQHASRTTDANSSCDMQQQGGSALTTALHAKHARLPAQSQAHQMLIGLPRRAVTRLDTDESLGDSSECGTVRVGAMTRFARVQHLPTMHGMCTTKRVLPPCSCMCLHAAHRLVNMPRPQTWACCQASPIPPSLPGSSMTTGQTAC